MTSAVQPPNRQTVVELFEQFVSNNSSAIAVVFEDRQLTYKELDQLANLFADNLLLAGIQPGQTVGLSIDRCPEAIAAMLGTLKCGAAFVPLDPEYPVDRIVYMIEDASISVVITHEKSTNPIAATLEDAVEIHWIDSASETFSNAHSMPLEQRPSPGDLAYVMYTSGSTGEPKGVEIQHSALTTYCLADIEVYELTSKDRTLQFSTLNFDIAIEEIFPPLLSGGCVVVRPSTRSEASNELSSIIDEFDVTAVHLATAYWHEWVDLMRATNSRIPASLRLAIATGEKVSVQHFRRWKELCEQPILWCNAYGPTEATVTATVFIPPDDFNAEQMPIGLPLPGYTAFILDDAMQPLDVGQTGQLYIAGPALARGYLNRTDLTQKAFVDAEINNTTWRLYSTGDLARWMSDGNIEFAGRVDHQIKLGSYRIEPGEIEAALNSHPQVLESLVTFDEVEGKKYLCAYLAIGQASPKVQSIAGHLSDRVPTYMLPARYVFLERFPKTINGKIDREALPSPDTGITTTHDSFVAPRDEIESQLCELWSATLNLPRTGIHDDFFRLGGSSLLVTRLVTEIASRFELELPVRDFFANPTVASSAAHIRAMLGITEKSGHFEEEQALARERLPVVDLQFIGSCERQIFSAYYAPRDSESWAPRQNHAILLCNSLGHEGTRSYRNLQQLALILCEAGFDVLRFDYFGTGNSHGSSSDGRFESYQADARRAAEHLLTLSKASKISAVGIRMGATIAATTNFNRPLDRIMLWDPVMDAHSYFRLCDDLHSYALNSQTRFSRVVSGAEPGQLFGSATSDEQRSSIERAKLSSVPDCKHLVLSSLDYAAGEPNFDAMLSDWNQVSTTDEIYWHRPEFSESAFASPMAYREITNFLLAGGTE